MLKCCAVLKDLWLENFWGPDNPTVQDVKEALVLANAPPKRLTVSNHEATEPVTIGSLQHSSKLSHLMIDRNMLLDCNPEWEESFDELLPPSIELLHLENFEFPNFGYLSPHLELLANHCSAGRFSKLRYIQLDTEKLWVSDPLKDPKYRGFFASLVRLQDRFGDSSIFRAQGITFVINPGGYWVHDEFRELNGLPRNRNVVLP